jgi:hypothetical protein
MYEVKTKNRDGQEIDIAVDVRFAKDMIEVQIDEAPEVIEKLAKDEFIYIEILTAKGPFGQIRIAEFEIAVSYHNGNQSCRVNTIVSQ